MKIGYPVTNLGLGHISSHTFRLSSMTEELFFKTAESNIDSFERTLRWNVENELLFYRISSGLIPFASHPAMVYDWKPVFSTRLQKIGAYIKKNDLRISMHPGQYVVLNSPTETVYDSSVRELQYHSDLLDLIGLDSTHKFQLHMGGVHGDKSKSIATFVTRYLLLPESIRRRLVIENDERIATLLDCIEINQQCGIPILFDTLHHQVANNGETVLKGLSLAMQTWDPVVDGVPMIDFSTQNADKKTGAHAVTLDVEKFRSFIKSLKGRDIDIMLEIKNKEASALQAKIVLANI